MDNTPTVAEAPLNSKWWHKVGHTVVATVHAIKRAWRARKATNILRQESAIQKADRKERVSIALAFNTRYVHGDKFFKDETGVFDGPEDGLGAFGFKVRKGNAWMCPSCNAIHPSIRMSTFVGLIFPECCEYPEGDRNDGLPSIATLKRPIGMFGPNGIYQQKRLANMT